jgi:hypothetical protein
MPRIAGLLAERDAAAVARIKALDSADKIIAGLMNAADSFRLFAVLCEQAHDLLTG